MLCVGSGNTHNTLQGKLRHCKVWQPYRHLWRGSCKHASLPALHTANEDFTCTSSLLYKQSSTWPHDNRHQNFLLCRMCTSMGTMLQCLEGMSMACAGQQSGNVWLFSTSSWSSRRLRGGFGSAIVACHFSQAQEHNLLVCTTEGTCLCNAFDTSDCAQVYLQNMCVPT